MFGLARKTKMKANTNAREKTRGSETSEQGFLEGYLFFSYKHSIIVDFSFARRRRQCGAEPR